MQMRAGAKKMILDEMFLRYIAIATFLFIKFDIALGDLVTV